MNRYKIPQGYRFKETGLWTPTDITTYAWHDASDSDTITTATGVSQWDDKSGVGINLTQGSGSEQPTLVSSAQNGLSTILFDGIDDSITIENTGLFSSSDIGFIYLFKPITYVTATGYGAVAYNGGAPDWEISQSNIGWGGKLSTWGFSPNNTIRYPNVNRIGTWTMFGGEIIPRVKYKIYLNGEDEGEESTTSTLDITTIDYRIGVGRGGFDYANIEFAEGIIFDRSHRVKVEGYLAWKWGLTNLLSPLHPYKNIKP